MAKTKRGSSSAQQAAAKQDVKTKYIVVHYKEFLEILVHVPVPVPVFVAPEAWWAEWPLGQRGQNEGWREGPSFSPSGDESVAEQGAAPVESIHEECLKEEHTMSEQDTNESDVLHDECVKDEHNRSEKDTVKSGKKKNFPEGRFAIGVVAVLLSVIIYSRSTMRTTMVVGKGLARDTGREATSERAWSPRALCSGLAPQLVASGAKYTNLSANEEQQLEDDITDEQIADLDGQVTYAEYLELGGDEADPVEEVQKQKEKLLAKSGMQSEELTANSEQKCEEFLDRVFEQGFALWTDWLGTADLNKDGRISWAEYAEVDCIWDDDVTAEEIDEWFRMADRDDDGQFTYAEYREMEEAEGEVDGECGVQSEELIASSECEVKLS